MSRLTRRVDGKVKMVGCAYNCKRCDGMDCTYPAIAIDKLCHYEDLEEQGRLIEQKHGQWDYNKYRQMYCSNCGEYPEIAVEWKYCPNCGAKMDEVENER